MTLPFSDSFIPFLEATLRDAFQRANAAGKLLWEMQNDPQIPEKTLALQTRTSGMHQQLVRSCTVVLRCLTQPQKSKESGARSQESDGKTQEPLLVASSIDHRPSAMGHPPIQNSPPLASPSDSSTQNSEFRIQNSPPPPTGSAPLSNSRNLEKILEKIPLDLAWRPGKDRLLCRRQVDAKQKAEFTRLAGRNALYGPTNPCQDGWPLEAKDWMLAADIFDRKAAKLPVPTAWEAVKIRSWLDTYARLGGGYPKLKEELRQKLTALESAWREELQKHFCRPEDAETLRAALQAFSL